MVGDVDSVVVVVLVLGVVYDTAGAETVVIGVVDAACLTAVADLLSAGVSYIIA